MTFLQALPAYLFGWLCLHLTIRRMGQIDSLLSRNRLIEGLNGIRFAQGKPLLQPTYSDDHLSAMRREKRRLWIGLCLLLPTMIVYAFANRV